MARPATPTTPEQAQKLYPTPRSFAAFLDSHWPHQRIRIPEVGGVRLIGGTVGDQWLNWYLAVAPNHPNYSLGDFEVTFFEIAAAESLGHAVARGEVATGQFTAQAENAVKCANYNPLAGMLAPLSEFAAVLDAAYRQLTKASMWRSLGWIVLGGALFLTGVLWWAKTEAGDVVGGVIKDII